MRRVELIIKPQNNTESFFVVEKHRIVFFMCSFCWREDWERATIFRFCLGDDSSSIFFLLIFFFFTRKQPFCFRLFYNTLKSNTRENSITKNIEIFFFEPLNFANYLQLLFGYYSQFNSVLLFCLKDQMIFKNEEETETITFQISTTELTKRKAKKTKVTFWAL